MAEEKGQRSAGTIKSFKCDLAHLMTAGYSQQKDPKRFCFRQIGFFVLFKFSFLSFLF